MVLSKTASESDVSVHSTFASRYIRTSLPRFKMPENSIPKEAACQIINDELMLDGNPREKMVYSFTKIHGILMFFIGVLSTILQTKNSQISPFKTNYATMSAFTVILFVYVLTMTVEIMLNTTQHPNWVAIFYNISVVFGTLTAVLLMLIIIPPFGWLIFILWMLFFAVIVVQTYDQHYQFLCKEVPLLFKKIISLPLVKRITNVRMNRNTSEQQIQSTI